MSQREIMKHSAAHEAAQWVEEEQTSLESRSDLWEQLTGIENLFKQLNARQARIENQLIHLTPSAKKVEVQFATLVLAGKELCEEMEQKKEDMVINLSQCNAQVTATANQINAEFHHQLKILQEFFDATVHIRDQNANLVAECQQLAARCQQMVATSSGVYHKGSTGVQEISEKTQAHLKAATESHRKEIETQAQYFKLMSKRLGKWIIIGTVIILLSAFVAGAMAGLMTTRYTQLQEKEDSGTQTR